MHVEYYELFLCRAFRKFESHKRVRSWFTDEQKNFRRAQVTNATRTSDELGGRNLYTR